MPSEAAWGRGLGVFRSHGCWNKFLMSHLSRATRHQEATVPVKPARDEFADDPWHASADT